MNRIFTKRQRLNWERFAELHLKKAPISKFYSDIIKRITSYQVAGTGVRSLLVTSVAALEGKTTTAFGLAAVLAGEGHKTLLVDANCREDVSPDDYWRQRNMPGLKEVLLGDVSSEEAIVEDKYISNLFFLSGGRRSAIFPETLFVKKIEPLLKDLSASYDFAIVDSLAIEESVDPLLLGKVVDGVVLVVLCDKTQKDKVRFAKSQIEKYQGKIIGVILNRTPKYVRSLL